MRIRKVLTFRAASIGDSLMAKYLFENMRAAYPEARFGIVVSMRAPMIRDLLAAYPWIEVIEANRRNVGSLWYLWKEFSGSDLVVTQYAGKSGGTFSLPSKIAARLLARPGGLYGFWDRSRFNFLYDRILPLDSKRAPREFEADLLTALSVPVSIIEPSLRYEPQPELLPHYHLTRGKYLVVHLFAGSAGRGMSATKRQELVDGLSAAFPQTPLVFTGSKTERDFIEALTLPAQAVNLAGELSVQELAALIDGCGTMVSIGTGPSHMASHLGKPLVVLVTCIGRPWCEEAQFGSKAAVVFSDDAACATGHDGTLPVPPCIEGIAIHEVVAEARRLYQAQNVE